MKTLLTALGVLALVVSANAQDSWYFTITVTASNDASVVLAQGFGRLTGNRFLSEISPRYHPHYAVIEGPAGLGTNALH